jgi:hypothetical protein
LQFESISSFSTDAVIIETGDDTASVFIVEIADVIIKTGDDTASVFIIEIADVIIETGDVTASVFIIEIDLENSVASKAVQPPLPSPVS